MDNPIRETIQMEEMKGESNDAEDKETVNEDAEHKESVGMDAGHNENVSEEVTHIENEDEGERKETSNKDAEPENNKPKYDEYTREERKDDGSNEEPFVVVDNEDDVYDDSAFLRPNASEDLKVLIQTYRDVNKHLDKQVEYFADQLESIKCERDAWKERCEKLTAILQQKGHEMEPFSLEAHPDKIDQLCRSITEDVSKEEFERDGVLIDALFQRGLASNWIIDSQDVTFLEILGEGAFGKTYLAKWNGALVCVKCVKVDTRQDQVSFFREIEALSTLRHPNIVPFVGACIQKPDKCWLMCEYMKGGTLSKWIHGDQSRPASILKRLEKALDVARGMEACEKCRPPITHRDLKPSNIFLDASRNARVGDFGLARRLNLDGISSLTGETGTYVYMSPEMIKHDVYNSATDVWSWGVLTCELMSKGLPYHGRFMTPIQVALGVSEGKLKPIYPTDVHPKLNVLLESVLSLDQRDRPTFDVIVEELSMILEELKANAQPEGFVRRLLRLQS